MQPENRDNAPESPLESVDLILVVSDTPFDLAGTDLELVDIDLPPGACETGTV